MSSKISFLTLSDAINRYPDYLLIGAVFLISTLALLPAWMNYDIISMDGVMLYIPVARLFLEGNVHEALYGRYIPLLPLPLYETLIFIAAKITGFSLETSGRLVAAAAYILGAVGIYKLTEAVFKNRITALVSVLLYMSHRKMLEYSVDCLKESLLVCIILWASFLFFRGIEKPGKRLIYIAAGSILFLSGALVRGTSLIFPAAWLLIWVFNKKEKVLTRALIFFLLVAVSIIMMLLLPEDTFFRRSLELPKYIDKFGMTYTSLADVVYGSINIIRDFIAKAYYLIALFGIIGIYYFRETYYARHLAVTLIVFFEIMLGFGWNNTGRESVRYIIAPIIYIMPMASSVVFLLLHSSRKPLKWLAVLVIVAAPFLWAGKAFNPPDPDRMARKEAGEWILSKVGPEQDIITNRVRIAFYAQGYLTIINVKPNKKKMEKQIGWGRENRRVKLMNVIKERSLKKVVVVDYFLDDFAKSWVKMLDDEGIKPDRIIRGIYIYLPESENE